MAEIVSFPTDTPTLAGAIEAFFSDRDLAANSRRTYRAAFRVLANCIGADEPVGILTGGQLQAVVKQSWGDAAPATCNARIAAIKSLARYCQRQGWLAVDPTSALERHRLPQDETKSIPYEDLVALWANPRIHLREKTLWRLLYATAARASEALRLDIDGLDLGRKRAVVKGKGDHRETIIWDAGTARLLPRYLKGRRRGPVFVTYGLPNVVPADLDRSPDGRSRHSYQRAWAIFHEASGGRWSLHQLRHSALTHLAEKGTSAPLLMAKSRHRDLRTLARYVRPGVEAVARLTAQHDPDRRGL